MYNSKHSHAQKTGWLHKRGGRIQTWHKRWFVLTGDLLFYYKSPQDSRPTGTIPLAGNNVVRHQDDFRQLHACKFEIIAGSGRDSITSTHDSYMISSESSEDADEWVAAIKRVLYEPYGGGMFGRSLEETMTVEARLGGEYVPILVHRCAKFILEHGINETGIFRLPGQSSRVQALKEIYDCGSQLDIIASEDVHTVASLLKLYLRELPEPVIPFSLFDDAIRISKDLECSRNGMTEMKRLLDRLPKCNYNLLKYICRFLYKISEHSEQNKMTNVNLATVFGPNILRPKAPSPHNIIESSNACASFCCALVNNQRDIFPLTIDEKPPKRLSIVNPVDISELCASTKSTSKSGGSLFIKSSSPKFERGRLGSVPSRLSSNSPIPFDSKSSKKKFAGLESPRQLRKFNAFSAFGDTLEVADTRSGRVSPLIFSMNDDELSSSVEIKTESTCDEESFAASESPPNLSPDLLVNSIAKEMENLERQLKVLKSSLHKHKKEARLWKSRYNQERKARVAAEERISDLQTLVDQTFQQFALDDSEDDDINDSHSDDENGESLAPESTKLGSHLSHNIYPSSLPAHVRHVRSSSTHFN